MNASSENPHPPQYYSTTTQGTSTNRRVLYDYPPRTVTHCWSRKKREPRSLFNSLLGWYGCPVFMKKKKIWFLFGKMFYRWVVPFLYRLDLLSSDVQPGRLYFGPVPRRGETGRKGGDVFLLKPKPGEGPVRWRLWDSTVHYWFYRSRS